MVKGRELESQLRRLTERPYAFATRSGSAAMVAALQSAGLRAGAEVIIPAICCPAVLTSIQFAGFRPVVADVSLDHLSMGCAELKPHIGPQTGAVAAVHGFGRTCPIDEIGQLCRRAGLFVLEDACLALGGRYRGGPVGSFGDAGLFSFGYDKIIDAGGGGALVCDDSNLAGQIGDFLARNPFFAMERQVRQRVEERLPQLGDELAVRRQAGAYYAAALAGDKVDKILWDDESVVWRYTALYRGDRNRLVEEAARQGLVITTHYPNLAAFRTGPRLANADRVGRTVINLFARRGTPRAYREGVVTWINGLAVDP